jgi:hypothetical protein
VRGAQLRAPSLTSAPLGEPVAVAVAHPRNPGSLRATGEMGSLNQVQYLSESRRSRRVAGRGGTGRGARGCAPPLRCAACALGADADNLDLWIARVALAAQLRTRRAHEESLQLLEPAIVALTSGRLPEAGWPSPRWLLARAQHQIASITHDQKHTPRALAAGRDALGTLDQLVRDYPDDQSLRRQRGNTANLVAVVLHQEKRWKDARPLLEQACRDQEFVLCRTPGDRNANRFLASHRQSLSVCLRELEAWPALADVARAMGSMPGIEQLAGRAARDLLRCAQPTPAAGRPCATRRCRCSNVPSPKSSGCPPPTRSTTRCGTTRGSGPCSRRAAGDPDSLHGVAQTPGRQLTFRPSRGHSPAETCPRRTGSLPRSRLRRHRLLFLDSDPRSFASRPATWMGLQQSNAR